MTAFETPKKLPEYPDNTEPLAEAAREAPTDAHEPLDAGVYRRPEMNAEAFRARATDESRPEEERALWAQAAADAERTAVEARGQYDAKAHAESQLERDTLTGLPNEAAFRGEVARLIERMRRFPADTAYVLYIDIDRFKPINDVYGHAAGDAYLTLIARQVRGVLRPGDTFARLHGDEFAIAVDLRARDDEQRDAAASVSVVAERVREAVYRAKCDLRDRLPALAPDAPPLAVGEHDTCASVGMVRYMPGDTVDALLQKADEEMYAVKQAHRSR